MTVVKKTENEQIRELNDRFRKTGLGGTVMLTHGIASLPEEDQVAIVGAVQRFDGFTRENDPYGEHDCAAVETGRHRVFFKIDYYNPELTHHSDDPTDPEKTMRVLTIMLPEEY
ncbi:DUF3768 domain-containing protein [Hoeflea poritis]|uniref:DUF3768 domain-containing protein n=1 Tax=Hoeflea poritis TaxID=2993659 RepID=A0ABT4VKX3_9HYPH|nr:DUF3768 domain-containing protein [Hoeflea poritis]MDA4845244.1 DUF3768 domain-containing protein [Hoeflea poritis]